MAEATEEAPHEYVSRSRAALYVLAVGMSVVGVVVLGMGVLVQLTPESRGPVPLGVGTVYTVPDRAPFVGDLVVYGTPPAEARPTLAELGCRVTDGGGPLSTERAALEDRIVAEGRGVVPLVSFPGVTGHSVVCDGPGAAQAAPLYVAPGANARDIVPLASYSAAALLVPAGAVGLLMLRASRR